MDLAALKSEIQADPLALGYASNLPGSPGLVVDLLNASRFTAVKSRFVTARTILAECGANAGALLDKLDALGAQSANVKWAMVFLKQDSGLDVGHPATQALLEGLAQAGALLQAEADQLKILALQPASRAEVLGFGPATEQDLRDAGVIA